MKTICVSLFCFVFIACVNTTPPSVSDAETEESPSDKTDNNTFSVQLRAQNRISLLEEFFDKFNKEYDDFGQMNRPKNIASLFDSTYLSQNGKDRANLFVNDVINRKVKIDFNNSDWFATAKVPTTHKGRNTNMTIVLKFQQNQDTTFQWVMVGVDAPFLNSLKPLNSQGLIRPNAHDMDFNRLPDALNDIEIKGTSFSGFYMDKLSIIYYLLQQKEITFKDIETIEFHFFQIPNWYFKLKRIDVLSSKSGWLICDLKQLSDSEKNQILMDTMGISQNFKIPDSNNKKN